MSLAELGMAGFLAILSGFATYYALRSRKPHKPHKPRRRPASLTSDMEEEGERGAPPKA